MNQKIVCSESLNWVGVALCYRPLGKNFRMLTGINIIGGKTLDDLIVEVYQRSGAPIRGLIRDCVNQVLNEAERLKECQPSPDTDHHCQAAETAEL